MAKLYSRSMLGFLWDCGFVLHNGYTTLHSNQQWIGAHFPPHPCQHLFISHFCMITTTPTGVRWNLTVVFIWICLIWISLMIDFSDPKQFFFHISVGHLDFILWKKYLSTSVPHFSSWLFVLLLLICWALYRSWVLILYQLHGLQHFL